jgi:outer membrane protein assembly factor BamB
MLGWVLVGVLALVGGGQLPTTFDAAATIPTDGIRDVRSDGQLLFLLRQFDVTKSMVQAYRLEDGVQLWSKTFDSGAAMVQINRQRVVLHVPEPGASEPSVLLGLSASTGTEVWRRPGYVPAFFGTGGALAVIVADPFTPGVDPRQQQADQRSRSRKLVAIDIGTGDIRWSLVTPPGTVHSYANLNPGFGDYQLGIAELAADGTLRVRSAASGEVVRTAKLEDPGVIDNVDISGDRLIAYRADQTGLAAGGVFDLTTGRRLWTLPPEAPGLSQVWWCGWTLCSGTEGYIAAIDPDTGRVRWRLDGWSSLDPINDHYLLATRAPPSGNATATGALIVDGATGRIFRRVTDWDVLSTQAWPKLLVTRQDAAGHATIGLLDVNKPGVTVVGRGDGWYGQPQCLVTTTFLTCKGQRLTIWRLPG